jgi:hypothetical protein
VDNKAAAAARAALSWAAQDICRRGTRSVERAVAESRDDRGEPGVLALHAVAARSAARKFAWSIVTSCGLIVALRSGVEGSSLFLQPCCSWVHPSRLLSLPRHTSSSLGPCSLKWTSATLTFLPQLSAGEHVGRRARSIALRNSQWVVVMPATPRRARRVRRPL